jgi:2-keto-3-deoxy-L-rhamnonate aldolase RhmA
MRANDRNSSRNLELIERVASVCKDAAFPAGIVCSGGEDARRWERAGFTLLALPSDVVLLAAGMRDHLAAARDSAR